MMYGYGMTGAGWAFMFVILFLLIALVVIAVLRIFPGREDRPEPWRELPRPETPREVLDRRLASGEIDLETYERLRQRLSAGGTRST